MKRQCVRCAGRGDGGRGGVNVRSAWGGALGFGWSLGQKNLECLGGSARRVFLGKFFSNGFTGGASLRGPPGRTPPALWYCLFISIVFW